VNILNVDGVVVYVAAGIRKPYTTAEDIKFSTEAANVATS